MVPKQGVALTFATELPAYRIFEATIGRPLPAPRLNAPGSILSNDTKHVPGTEARPMIVEDSLCRRRSRRQCLSERLEDSTAVRRVRDSLR